MKNLKLVSKIIIIFVISFFTLFLIKTINLAENRNYVYVEHGAILSDIIDRLDYYDDVSFYDSKNNLIDDYNNKAKTGITISCLDQDDTSYQYKLVVKGDVNGDGNIDQDDIYSIKCGIVGLSTLENEYLEACDNNTDNTISLHDLFYTNQYIKNQSTEEDEQDIEISKIELNTSSLDLNIGETFNLTYSITPENPTYTDVNYFSMDSNIVSVDNNGLVTPINNGFTQILVTCSSGASATCDVSVHTVPQKLELDTEDLELFINGESSYVLQPSFTPSTSNVMTNISWKSANSDIVSVDENGNLTAKKNGTTTITATSEGNLMASCNITVYTIPSELTIPNHLSIEKDSSTKIEAIISPNTSNYDTDITWQSSNSNIISISEDGTITALANGTATVKASTKNGITADCTVYVYKAIKDIILSSDSTTIDLSKNSSYRIFANSETGEDITNILSWESTDSNIATVDESGKITAISNGTTTITASLNEDLKKTFTLTVQTSPKTLTLNKNDISLTLGDSEQLTYTINPETSNIFNNVTWQTSNPSIVSVTDTGLIQAMGVGRVVIVAKCENNVLSTCYVTVTKTPSEMTFDKDCVLVENGSTNQLLLTFNMDLSNIDLDTLLIENENDTIVSYSYETYNDNQIKLIVTGLQDGHSRIRATIGEVSTSCEVIVYSELHSLELYAIDTHLTDTSYHYDLSNSLPVLKINATLFEEKFDVSKLVSWSSSDPQVISVDDNGLIKLLSPGTAVISAHLNDTISASFTMILEASPTSIDISSSMNLYINNKDTSTIAPTITPAYSNIKNGITYYSSNPKVASVDDNGVVTAHSSGNTIITATTENGKSDTCKVIVRTVAQRIDFDSTTKYLRKDASMTLRASITPSYADTLNNISWSSSNSNIVSVDNSGNLLAKQPGSATITAKTGNNKSATIQITVPDLSMNIGNNTLDLSNLSTTNITNNNSKNIGNLSYSSNNPSIATVDSNGKVTAISNGRTSIHITESNANTQISIPITVKTSTKKLSLNTKAVSLDIADSTFQLSATHSPTTVSSKSVTWSSSNTKVATVNNGKISRVGPGTATITAKANDGSNKTVTCSVTVKQEKLIIVGASTVVQLAGRRTCSTKSGDYANINFYKDYGYTVRSTSEWNTKFYSSFKSHTGLTDKKADLFFVCKGGTGLKWLAGKRPQSYYDKSGPAGEGREQIDEIIKNNPNCHFTLAFMHGGNDFKLAKSKEEVDEVATTYASYYKSLAKDYPDHDFYIFPPTPVDMNSAVGYKKATGYNSDFSTNTKRSRFDTKLNEKLKNSSKNLKYSTNFFNEIMTSKKLKCYDGNHFQHSTAKYVLNTILKDCKVLQSGKKK